MSKEDKVELIKQNQLTFTLVPIRTKPNEDEFVTDNKETLELAKLLNDKAVLTPEEFQLKVMVEMTVENMSKSYSARIAHKWWNGEGKDE